MRSIGLVAHHDDTATCMKKDGIDEKDINSDTSFKLNPLPDYGRSGDALAFFIGNLKALWPYFLDWMRKQSLSDPNTSIPNPLDSYTTETISTVIQRFAGNILSLEIFWGYDTSPERLVDLNRASMVSQVCYFCDKLHLSVHPKFGSWVGFRAVVVLNATASHLGGLEPPPPLTSLISEDERILTEAALADALRATSEEYQSTGGMTLETAHKWAEMRNCVSLGREYKYLPLQSQYHYVKDPKLLRKATTKSLYIPITAWYQDH